MRTVLLLTMRFKLSVFIITCLCGCSTTSISRTSQAPSLAAVEAFHEKARETLSKQSYGLVYNGGLVVQWYDSIGWAGVKPPGIWLVEKITTSRLVQDPCLQRMSVKPVAKIGLLLKGGDLHFKYLDQVLELKVDRIGDSAEVEAQTKEILEILAQLSSG